MKFKPLQKNLHSKTTPKTHSQATNAMVRVREARHHRGSMVFFLLLLTLFSKAYAQRFSYEIGLWLEEDGAFELVKDQSWEDFSAQKQTLNRQGLHLVDLETYLSESGLLYSGVFRAGTGANPVLLQATWSRFDDHWRRRGIQGMHLVDLVVTRKFSRPRFSGVWASGVKTQAIEREMSLRDLIKRQSAMAKRGMHIVDLETYRKAGKQRFVAIFEKSKHPAEIHVGLPWNSFHEKYHALGNQGKRLIDLEAYIVNGATRYLGVWRPGCEEDYLFFGPFLNADVAEDAGLPSVRPIDLEYVIENGNTESVHPHFYARGNQARKDPCNRGDLVLVARKNQASLARAKGGVPINTGASDTLVQDQGDGVGSGRAPIHEGGSVGPGN